MAEDLLVSPDVFKSLQTLDVKRLSTFSAKEIRPILPCLVRMSLISPVDTTKSCSEARKEILTILSGIEMVNSIVALLSIDFHALETDVKREQQLRQKVGSSQSDSLLVPSLQNGLAMDFERSDPTRRLRLVLSEILFISSQIQEEQQQQRTSFEMFVKHSDLFENAVYIPEICDVLNIALSELPALLSPVDIVETLLHVKHGQEIICWIVANSPDCFWEVCKTLVTNADKLEDESNGGKIRIQALSLLCRMCPSMSLAVRAKCVELCKMPGLAISLTLEHAAKLEEGSVGDIVSFVSGLLLGNDQSIRNWFSSFIRIRQKRNRESNTSLQALRDELLRYLNKIVTISEGNRLPEAYVVQASSLLRLYCALRGIAGIKLQEEEISLLVQLVTSHPPTTTAGVRFVSLGLCMIIACPSLIGNHEAKCIEWVQWLVREEAYLESGVSSSFGEMLLLMAIHFHSNQLSCICELVCSTLGMKVPIRHNNMTRMKHVFTHEIFTEQVVTSHAVKVPVTLNLNANIPGFLPVHCIHQLLKSRAFTKYKVPIKDWIYRQLCVSVPPLHPVLPALVEVYVNSILMPAGKSPQENTNQPITEDEIRAVFSNSLVQGVDKKKNCLGGMQDSEGSLTTQLLMLYFLLHYEDVRLSSSPVIRNRVKSYSQEFLSELPIKYLLQQAQKDQSSYGGLFPSLVRLLATHFPHLCLVDDWMERQSHSIGMLYTRGSGKHIGTLTEENVEEGLSKMTMTPSYTGELLGRMLDMPPTLLWKHSATIIKYLKHTLDPSIPRYIQELYKHVWLRLNSVLPRCLWVMTTNALLMDSSLTPRVPLTQEDVVQDPLQVLRCDTRVYRCAPVLSILLRVLQSCLAASQSQLARHALDNPLPDKNSAPYTDSDREDLRNALVSAQESLAVQILLEACSETDEDKMISGQSWALREARSVICSYLHQVFIAEPSLAKLVHFQGYSRKLLPVTISGVPSLHICLDNIPELLSQPELEKQVFAIDLVSHLALQYALPKAMSVSRLAINTLSTLLTVLPSHSRAELFLPALDCLVRICSAFPPLVEDVVSLLMQLGRICTSEASLTGRWASSDEGYHSDEDSFKNINSFLCAEVQLAFENILKYAVLKVDIY